MRIKTGGGVAGHNGLRSIAEQLGLADFKRVRMGIGHPGDKDLASRACARDFSADDREWVARLLDAFVEAAPLLAAGDDAGCMNRIALRMQPPKSPRRDPPPFQTAESASAMGFNCGIVGLPNVGKSTPVQRHHRHGGRRGRELSVLHDRTEPRTRAGAGSAS